MRIHPRILNALVAVSCLLSFDTEGQTHIRQVTERDGLSYRWVLDITQDDRGFLWFATYDGLNRFDGREFVTYKHSDIDSNTISSSLVYHVAADSQGGIWTYGVDLVLNRIDLATGIAHRVDRYRKDGLAYDNVRVNLKHFAPLTTGEFVILFQAKDMPRCDFWRYVPEEDLLEHIISIPAGGATINYFSERTDGKIWLWGLGIGYYLVNFEKRTFEYFPVPAIGAKTPAGVSIPIDAHHTVWYPSNDARDEPIKKIDLPAGIRLDRISHVRNDNASGLWLNYGDSTLYRLDPATGSLEKFTDAFFGESADHRAMQRIYKDRDGAYWSGHFYGAARFENAPKWFDVYLAEPITGSNPGPSQFSAREMIEYGSDKLIVRGDSSQLMIVDVRTGEAVPLTRRPAPSVGNKTPTGIHSMLVDRQGSLWSNQGPALVRTNLTTGIFDVFQGPPVPVSDHPRIFQDAAGRIWWCGATGVSLFDRDRQVMTPLSLELPAGVDFTFAIYDPGTDQIHGACPEGIYTLDCASGTGFRTTVFQERERDYRIMAILHWKEEYWLSTNNGLIRFDPATGDRSIYTRKDGLPSDIVYAALGSGTDLWLSTHNGLCRLDPTRRRVSIFYEEHGLPNNEFNRWSCLQARDGRIYFGGLNGFVGFHPEDLAPSASTAGPLSLLEIATFHEKRDETVSVPIDPYTPLSTLRISPYQRTIAFRYILPHFQDVERVQYFHFLEGLEHDWIDNGHQNDARYIQVPPGEYTFRVKATGPAGTPAANEIAVRLVVMQYWYLRWWAVTTYIGLALLGVWIVYRYQLSRRLERQEVVRVRELEAVKSRMYTNITHEFRTPLTVMLGMNETVNAYAAAGELDKVQHATEMVGRNARNLLDLVNQMLDLSKLESGMQDIHAEYADVMAYLRYRLEAFQSYAAGKHIRVNFNPGQSELFMDFDPDRVSHIVNNLMSNAIKFTPAGGQIDVSAAWVVRSGRPFLEFSVRDTGVGIEKDKIDHVFDRFYQAGTVPWREGEGTGVGLSLVHELVKLLGGQITVESEPGVGSVFTVLLPIVERGTTGDSPDTPVIPLAEKATEDVDENGDVDEKPLVLVVEDSVDVAHYIRTCIEQGYRTVTAADGNEGIRLAIELIPDVIISDVMMPGADGYQLCRSVKQDERTSHIPVILLTAKADQEARIEGLEQGADAYLAKPFDRKELLIRLRNLLTLRAELQRRYTQADHDRPAPEEAGSRDEFILKVRSRILEHLQDEDFDVNALCRLAHVSRAQLHRKLTAVTGQSASQLIRHVQLERARELLRQPDLSISEVAYQAGFKTQAHFSRVFSETCGEPPSEYRRKHLPGAI